MGGNQSNDQFPTLPHEQKVLDLSNQQLHQIPLNISHKNNLLTLNISGNFITNIPTKLKKLQKLIIENNNLTSIPDQFEKAINHMKHLEQLDLSFNSLSDLPDYIYKLPHLTRLELRGNKFSILSTFSDSLEFLDLSQNEFEVLPKLPSSILAVFYNYNRIKTFNPILPNVRFIFCSMNQLTTINKGVIFHHLQTLDLSMNLLTDENIAHFKIMAPSLQKLDLSFNRLTVFPDLPSSLMELNLSYNKLTSIPDIDESLPNLDVLKVTNNLVEEVGKLPSSLTSLLLGENQIKSIQKSHLPKLEVLQIFSNKLKNPPDLVYTKVKDVFIVSNKLKSFELIFLGSGNDKNDDDDHNGENNSPSHIPLKINPEILTRLNLSNNKLEKISPNVFELPNLIYLNVEKNRLTDLPRQVSHSKLLFLNVSENPFEMLKFDLPMSIMTFYCSSCKLKEIPLSFTDCESLCILYCMDNEIEKLPELPYIGMINASNNKIKEFPFLPKCIQQIDLSLNLIEKVPDKINNLKGVIELDLSYNKLKKLPDIQNLTGLIFLKLSHNFDLEGEIDLQLFEKIETVDISFTKMTVNDIPVDVIRELIISYPSNASNQINDPNSRGLQTPIVFTYPQIKVMTESDFASYSEMRGTRETMEDAILVRPFITKNCDVYALLDGHGGSDTSNYGVFKIAELFSQIENFDVTEESVKSVVANLIDSLKKQNFGDGATMALAVLTENKVVAANLGDSRVLLIGKNGDIKFSLRDHKPVFREEIDRILSVGGKIVCGRVDGVLAVSRCLGDFSIRGVSYDPEIVISDIDNDEDRWLVLCCDGVFDVISNDDVAEIAKTAKNAADLAYRLRNTAAVRLSTDNISAIAVDLKERNKKASKMKANKE